MRTGRVVALSRFGENRRGRQHPSPPSPGAERPHEGSNEFDVVMDAIASMYSAWIQNGGCILEKGGVGRRECII